MFLSESKKVFYSVDLQALRSQPIFSKIEPSFVADSWQWQQTSQSHPLYPDLWRNTFTDINMQSRCVLWHGSFTKKTNKDNREAMRAILRDQEKWPKSIIQTMENTYEQTWAGLLLFLLDSKQKAGVYSFRAVNCSVRSVINNGELFLEMQSTIALRDDSGACTIAVEVPIGEGLLMYKVTDSSVTLTAISVSTGLLLRLLSESDYRLSQEAIIEHFKAINTVYERLQQPNPLETKRSVVESPDGDLHLAKLENFLNKLLIFFTREDNWPILLSWHLARSGWIEEIKQTMRIISRTEDLAFYVAPLNAKWKILENDINQKAKSAAYSRGVDSVIAEFYFEILRHYSDILHPLSSALLTKWSSGVADLGFQESFEPHLRALSGVIQDLAHNHAKIKASNSLAHRDSLTTEHLFTESLKLSLGETVFNTLRFALFYQLPRASQQYDLYFSSLTLTLLKNPKTIQLPANILLLNLFDSLLKRGQAGDY